jgi:hypothetical protein
MLRAILCGAMIVVIAVGCNRAGTKSELKGRGRFPGARGTITSVDPAAGTLTVNARSRQNPDGEEKTFQVEDDTTITSFTGEAKKELKGKDGLRDPQFKAGSRVAVTTSEDGGKVVSIQVGDMPRGGGRNRGNRGNKGPVQ